MNRHQKIRLTVLVCIVAMFAISTFFHIQTVQAYPVTIDEPWSDWDTRQRTWGKMRVYNGGRITGWGEHSYDFQYCFIDKVHVIMEADGCSVYRAEWLKVKIKISDGGTTTLYESSWEKKWDNSNPLVFDSGIVEYTFKGTERWPGKYSIKGLVKVYVWVRGHFANYGDFTNSETITIDY